MAFQLSPGVNVSEIDLSTVIPAVATSTGAFAGTFAWGPVNQIVSIPNESRLVDTFGKPNANNYVSWFSAANFLAYSNNLKVVRAANTSAGGTTTATSNGSISVSTSPLIQNDVDYDQNWQATSNAYGAFAARYPGSLGNGLQVYVCPNANAFEANLGLVLASAISTTSQTSFTLGATAAANIAAGDTIAFTANGVTTSYLTVTSVNSVTNIVTTDTAVGNTFLNVATAYVQRRWKYYNQFPSAPSTSDYATRVGGSRDEMHIVVVDSTSQFSSVPNTVIEKFGFVSKASDAKNSDGTTNYYKDVITNKSKYIWWLAHPQQSSNWGTSALNKTFAETSISTSATSSYLTTLANGNDGVIGDSQLITGYNFFSNPDTVDVSLIISGNASATLATSLASLAESRKDSLVFLSPPLAAVVDNAGLEASDIATFRNSLTSSSYVVMDSAWKYQYDKYNDLYRWLPLNGDIAGLSARTDLERDPWFSPAGAQRGIIKNVVKLSWNPSKSERDSLYSKGINPVVTFPGEGTMLYGDKTLLSRPSAFDRINVRRLFITLEKAIARAARSTMFEFNDQFTRAQFVNLVGSFLRDVQGRRGIIDFRVVCDETNNTPEVIDRNEFVGDIYIKPSRSVNFIQLNFVAVRTGVSFDEITGKF